MKKLYKELLRRVKDVYYDEDYKVELEETTIGYNVRVECDCFGIGDMKYAIRIVEEFDKAHDNAYAYGYFIDGGLEFNVKTRQG